MKKIILFICLILCLKSIAQTNVKDFRTVFYQEVIFETDDYKMFLVRCFSRVDILKIKVRVFNKTKDVIYIKPEEFKFNIDGKSVKVIGRPLIVKPDDEDSQLIDVKGEGDMRCEKFDVVLNGVYKVSLNHEIYEATNTDGKKGNEINAGPFKCNKTIGQTTKEKSFSKFECTYSGDKIGVLDPNKSVAIMSTGKENPSGYPKQQIFILENGGSAIITTEYRKQASAGDLTDGYQIKWNDTFKASSLIPLKVITVPMMPDFEKSEK